MIETCRQVLTDVGVNPARLALEWASAAEGPRFVQMVTNYVGSVKALGPLGSAEGEADAETIRLRLEATTKAFEVPKVRTAYANLAKSFHKSGDYGAEAIADGVRQKVIPAFRSERLAQEVPLVLGQGAGDLPTLIEKTGCNGEEITKILETLSKKGTVKEDGSKWLLA